MIRLLLAILSCVGSFLYEYRVLVIYAAVVLFCVFGTQWLLFAGLRAAKPA